MFVHSVCTSFTADMDMSEEEITRLREENQVLRNQLELLRVNSKYPDDSISQDYNEYDDSVAPDSLSNASEYVGEPHAVSESVMKQICTEVEIVTEEVITKTRAESESKIAKLENELEDLKAALDRSKRLAKYDMDDMTRVNRSLRDELETTIEDLELKCEELDTLNDDIERIAETFAEQHEEVQHLERQTKTLQASNDVLNDDVEHKMKRIKELETQSQMKAAIGKLWEEIGRMKDTQTPDASVSSNKSERQDGSLSSHASREYQERGNGIPKEAFTLP